MANPSMNIGIMRKDVAMHLLVREDDLVAAVHVKLYAITSVKPNHQRLYLKDELLAREQSLEEQGVKKDSTLVLCFQKEDETWEAPTDVVR